METCTSCRQQFGILPEDQKLYDEYKFPRPTLCPGCRHQERCAQRNERTLYKRKCDLCKTPIITIFSGARPFPVYCSDCWWSDRWDPLSYGRDFDFSRPFFDQFRELQDVVPRLALNNVRHENSEYCNQSTGNKNSYLLFGSDDNEDSMYGVWINRCIDTYNSNNLADCRNSCELLDSENCTECVASQDLKNCYNCSFCFDLIGCSNCFGSAGLRNKQYYILNTPYGKVEYFQKIAEFDPGSFTSFSAWQQRFREQIRLMTPHKYAHILQSENVSGDYISQSKNCQFCFDIFDAEDSRYAYNLVHRHFRNVDVSYVTELRNAYQVTSGIGQDIFLSMMALYCSDIWYSDLAFSAEKLFGCVGIRHEQQCIFNRKYVPKEFLELRSKVMDHMRSTGEWGLFFPVKNSLYAYNESVASDFFPLTKAEILARGWRCKEPDRKEYRAQTVILPDHIRDTPPNIVKEVLACTSCGKNYRMLEKELTAYSNLPVPLPRLCPDCRYLERLQLRNPRQLWARNCVRCGIAVESTYAPDRPEEICCEKCYLEALN